MHGDDEYLIWIKVKSAVMQLRFGVVVVLESLLLELTQQAPIPPGACPDCTRPWIGSLIDESDQGSLS